MTGTMARRPTSTRSSTFDRAAFYPAEFITIKQRQKRQAVWDEYVVRKGETAPATHSEPEGDAVNFERQAAVVDPSNRDRC